MKLSALQHYFREELALYYTASEIDELFFYLLFYSEGYNRKELILGESTALFEEYESYVTRLKKMEPVQYIAGETIFCDLKFKVNPKVLIPRPETEELVEWVFQDLGKEFVGTICDLGTGSGCIALSLKKQIPRATISAVDVSEDALEVARRNGALLALEVLFGKLDILKDELPNAEVYVSNPPYIPFEDKNFMEANVLDYEPSIALFADPDPLIFYKTILQNSKAEAHYFEIHPKYANALSDFVELFGWNFELRKDLYCKERMMKVIRR